MAEQKNKKSPTENGIKYATTAAIIATGAALFDGSTQTHTPETWQHMECTPEIKKRLNPNAPDIIFNSKLAKLAENGNFNYQNIKAELGDDVRRDEHGEYISIGIKSKVGSIFLPHYISINGKPVSEEKLDEIADTIKKAIHERNAYCGMGASIT